MYIAYNYTSSVHDLELFNIINDDGQSDKYRTYNYSRDHSNNDGIKCVINGESLPVANQKRCE